MSRYTRYTHYPQQWLKNQQCLLQAKITLKEPTAPTLIMAKLLIAIKARLLTATKARLLIKKTIKAIIEKLLYSKYN